MVVAAVNVSNAAMDGMIACVNRERGLPVTSSDAAFENKSVPNLPYTQRLNESELI